jgi:hypothetical protein
MSTSLLLIGTFISGAVYGIFFPFNFKRLKNKNEFVYGIMI